MKIGKIFFFISFILSIIFAILCWCVPFREIFSIDNGVYVTDNSNTNFGNFVSTKYNEKTESVDFLLFNALKIHSVNALETGKKVLLGGETIGFSYHGNGVLVVAKGDNCVGDIEAGDVIKCINNENINSVSTLSKVVNSSQGELKVKLVRDGKTMETKVKPAYDTLTKKYKLGIWARENMSGLGTLTFIDPETSRFGALGHPILEKNTKTIFEVESGNVHECTILGVKKAERGMPGELQGIFVRSKTTLGKVDKNCESGMYGTINLDHKLFSDNQLIEVGGRLSAHPGKAVIYSSIDGKNIKAYDIEIIKTNYQSSQSPKNLVFKVIDKELIDLTGGIVQGMSGSPIVQDGKLIGAVTHVFVNDATKGFGIYIDSMLGQ